METQNKNTGHLLQEIRIVSSGAALLRGLRWLPPEKPRGVVVHVHGLGEHCRRYRYVARHIKTSGFVFQSLDLRGHGLSSGKRGHAGSMDYLLDDIGQSLMIARKDFQELPLFIYGHSMGGNIVANYLLKRSASELKGAVFTSPWFRLAEDVPAFQVKLVNLIAGLLPALALPNGLNVNDISSDPEVVEAYVNDPLVHNRISARMISELYVSGLYAIENAREIDIPVLVMHGDQDKITSYDGSKDFTQNAGSNAVFKSWPGMKHETHNEPDKDAVLDYMVKWMESVL